MEVDQTFSSLSLFPSLFVGGKVMMTVMCLITKRKASKTLGKWDEKPLPHDRLYYKIVANVLLQRVNVCVKEKNEEKERVFILLSFLHPAR